MAKDKDLKRLIRVRMEQTGEAHTAARAHIRAMRSPPKAEYADLAGMSDEAVAAKTGKSWADWVAALDAIEAMTLAHRDIAQHVQGEHDVTQWWAQTVTVGYERIRGLREKGQRREGTSPGSYEISKSKTFSVPVEMLYAAFSAKKRRFRWLPVEHVEIRASQQNRSLRMGWPDGTRVNAWFTNKGPDKSSVQVMHEGLPDKETGKKWRDYWDERLRVLGGLLE